MRGLLNSLMYEIACIAAMIVVFTIIYFRYIKSSFIKNKDNKKRYISS